MNKWLSILFLFSVASLSATGSQVVDSQRSLFQYSKDENLTGQVRYRYDLVVLEEGSLIKGNLEEFPSLNCDTGVVSLPVEDVVLVTRGGGGWMVRTSKGKEYTGKFSNDSWHFVEYSPGSKGNIARREKTIPINGVSFLLLKPREATASKIAKVNPHPLLTASEGFKIPEVIFIDPEPLLANVTDFYIPQVDFRVEPEPLLAVQGDIEVPEIDFYVEPEPLLAVNSQFEVPEIDFKGEPNPIFAANQEISIPSILFINQLFPEETTPQMTHIAHVLAFGEEIEFVDDGSEGSNEDSEEDAKDEIIFISEGEAQREPFLVAAGSKKENESVAFNNKPLSERVLEKQPAIEERLLYVENPEKKGGFYIRNRKVTNREYKAFVDAINYSSPVHWINGQIPPGEEDDPVVNVSYKDTLLFSVWKGMRLPTQEELDLASQTDELLIDEQVNEWTATPYRRDQSNSGKQSVLGTQVGGLFSTSHVIFGANNPNPMRNHESNQMTGFRLVATQ